jgi:hypothetical protein
MSIDLKGNSEELTLLITIVSAGGWSSVTLRIHGFVIGDWLGR